MANFYKEHLTWDLIYFLFVFITFITLLIRFYVRIYVRGSPLSWSLWRWSDVFLVITWIIFFALAILNIIITTVYKLTPEIMDKSYDNPNFVRVRKLGFAFNVSFWVLVYLLKAAMLCFFNEFISREAHYPSWLAIRITAALTLIGGLSLTAYSIAWCLPINRQWSKTDSFCWVDYSIRFRETVYRQAWHVLTDLMIIVLPLPVLFKLRNVPLASRIGAAIMFTLGFFSTACAICLTMSVLNWDHGGLNSNWNAIWFMQYEPLAEVTSAIILQCIPAMRAVIVRGGELKKRRKASSDCAINRDVVEIGQARWSMSEGSSKQAGDIGGLSVLEKVYSDSSVRRPSSVSKSGYRITDAVECQSP